MVNTAEIMVEQQLMPRNISSEAVLDAMRQVPRHLFVPEHLREYAYNDSPLPISSGQTISQPYIVAYMTEQLGVTPGMKVLEVGTGSGYQTAVLAHLECKVYSIEVHKELADKASEILASLGYKDVSVKLGNGYSGWQEAAPFDAIIVTAAPSHVPTALLDQLCDGGRMVVPVGAEHSVQFLKLITKKDGQVFEDTLLPVRFVPMVE